MSNSISLGKMSLGKMSLGRIGGEMVVSSGGGGPLYKRILASMPDELRKSLVCWYSPNLQGLTSAELYDSDNLYVGGLHDLSGNGYNMDLYGFDGIEGGGHVDEDGNLVCDGVNDWGNSVGDYSLNKASLFIDIANYKRSSANCVAVGLWNSTNTNGGRVRVEGIWQSSSDCVLLGKPIDALSVGVNARIVEGTSVASNLSIIKPRGGLNNFASIAYKSIILFNETLSNEEIDWVKANMLVSQEPSKRTVTLWLVDEEIGSFDKFKALKVQDGNMIGKYDEDGNLILPIYDVDAIHQTSLQWYTDVDCTEEYSGEYITEDTFLYAKKVRTSDNMLAQLDNVVLEDGTTAREHLVCWYSPKWQGLTRESVLAEATLADLSGNGYDMALQGYTEESDVFDEYGWLILDGNIKRLTTDIKVPLTDFTILDSVFAINGSSVFEGFQPSISTSADSFGYCLRSAATALSYSLGSEKRKSIPNAMNVRGDVVVSVSSVDNCYITFNEYSNVGVPNTYSCKALSYWLKGNMEVHKEYCLLFDTTLSDTEILKVKSILKLQ